MWSAMNERGLQLVIIMIIMIMIMILLLSGSNGTIRIYDLEDSLDLPGPSDLVSLSQKKDLELEKEMREKVLREKVKQLEELREKQREREKEVEKEKERERELKGEDLQVKNIPSLQEARASCPPGYQSTHAIVTAADSPNHFGPVQHLITSVTLHEPCVTLIVYDLGFSEEESKYLSKVQGHPGGFIFRKFPYEKYPPYFDVNVAAGEYAWKPVIIEEVLRDFEYVVWMDSGDKLNSNLNDTFELIEQEGFYSSPSKGNITEWTHRGMMEYLKASRNSCQFMKNCNAAFVAFYREKSYKELVVPWKDCAVVKECIAPEGSNRDNHRQDQAALSVLVCLSNGHFRCEFTRQRKTFAIHLDNRIMILSKMDLFQVPIPTTLSAIKDHVCNRMLISEVLQANCKHKKCFTASMVLGFLATYTSSITTGVSVGLFGDAGLRSQEGLRFILGPKAGIQVLKDSNSQHVNLAYFEDLSEEDYGVATSIVNSFPSENWLVASAKTSQKDSKDEILAQSDLQLFRISRRQNNNGSFFFEEIFAGEVRRVAITFASHQRILRY